VASRPDWSLPLGGKKETGKDKEGREDDENAEPGSPRSLDLADVTGDGLEEVLVRVEGEGESSALVVVRRP
jgi:hypothetical protein